LVWVGTPGVIGFNGYIDVAQYPTPEPASVGLLALGGLLVFKRRQNRLA